MRRTLVQVVAVTLVLGGCLDGPRDAGRRGDEMADLLFTGGDILTLDPEGPRSAALALAGGEVLAVGGLEEVERHAGAETRRVDLGGRTLMPAFTDHHVHLLNVGLALVYRQAAPPYWVDLAGAGSLSEVAALVGERATGLPEGSWILGQGWSQGAGPLPGHELLTEAAPRHPVFLTRVDGHAGWANARALELAGIGRETRDPPGGAILRRADGAPAGVLLERANELLTPHLPAPTDEEVRRAFRAAAAAAAARGVVEAFDAGFLAPPGVVALDLDLERYRRLLLEEDRREPLPLRVDLMVPAPSALAEELAAEPERIAERSPRVRITHLKLFADGAMGSRGGALSHPFADDPSTSGVPRMSTDEIHQWSVRALGAGLDVATHAIGDAAVAAALDAYERLLAERPDLDPRRLRIEHFSYAREADLARAAALGVVLSIQPNFVAPDEEGRTMEESRLSSAHTGRVYAWGRLGGLGARLAFGSDDFALPQPALLNLFAAVARQHPSGSPPGGWHPENRLERAEAVRLLALRYLPGGGEPRGGALVPGGAADLVVLSANPLEAPQSDLARIEVDATLAGGVVTFARGELASSLGRGRGDG